MPALKKIEFNKLHILLIPVFFILHNYFDFFEVVNISRLILPVLSWLLLPLALYFILFKIVKNSSNTFLLTSVLLLIFFFGAGIIKAVKHLPYIGFVGKYSVAIPLLFILVLVLFFYFRSTQKDFKKLHTYLTFTFTALLLFDVLWFFTSNEAWRNNKNSFTVKNTPVLTYKGIDTSRPDIFFLIFDEHPSTASVKTLTGYNNSLLDDSLRKLNFEVSGMATSGFAKTRPALCSLFEMSEFSYDSISNISYKELFIAEKVLSNNVLLPFFQKSGYSIINASAFDFKNYPGIQPIKDWWGEPEGMIINQTLFNRIHEDLGWLKSRYFPSTFSNPVEISTKSDSAIIDIVKSKIDSCLQLPSNQQKFVFAHFPLPHSPFKYDSTGKFIHWSFNDYMKAIQTPKPLIEQIAYSRNFILEMAASIQKNNKRPALIIIQGDHGLRNFDQQKYNRQEMFKILCAIYAPGKENKLFANDHFAPNTFRLVLNRYFQQQLPLQKEWHIELNTGENDTF
jgi:hypothetical protein